MSAVGKFLQHGRFHFFLQRIDRFAAIDLLLVVERAFDAIAGDLIGHFENLLVHRHQRHLAFRFADLRREFLLDADHFLRVPVRELERLDEIGFGQFQGGAFDHDDVVFRADVNEIEIALVPLVVGRVGDELAIQSVRRARRRSGRRTEYRKRVSAAEAPLIARMSGSFWPSALSRIEMICVS